MSNHIIGAKDARKMMKLAVNPKVAARHEVKMFNKILIAAKAGRASIVYGVQVVKYPLISALSNVLLEQGYKVSQRERASYTALKIRW